MLTLPGSDEYGSNLQRCENRHCEMKIFFIAMVKGDKRLYKRKFGSPKKVKSRDKRGKKSNDSETSM